MFDMVRNKFDKYPKLVYPCHTHVDSNTTPFIPSPGNIGRGSRQSFRYYDYFMNINIRLHASFCCFRTQILLDLSFCPLKRSEVVKGITKYLGSTSAGVGVRVRERGCGEFDKFLKVKSVGTAGVLKTKY